MRSTSYLSANFSTANALCMCCFAARSDDADNFALLAILIPVNYGHLQHLQPLAEQLR